MADLPDNGRDYAVHVRPRRHGTIRFAIVGAAVFSGFGEVLAVDFKRADARGGVQTGEGHSHFDVVAHERDGEIVERLGERHDNEFTVVGEVFEFGGFEEFAGALDFDEVPLGSGYVSENNGVRVVVVDVLIDGVVEGSNDVVDSWRGGFY